MNMAKILLVDDEESIRLTVSASIREDGHEVHTAVEVAEAFELMKEHDFDVIVSDIIMPRISGMELLRKIRKSSPDIPIVMLTGEPEVNTASEAVRTGAFDYLSKPVSGDTIRKVIRNAVGTKELNDEKKRLEEENRKYQEHLEELVEERTREVRESEKKYRLLFEESIDAIYLTDVDGILIDCNSALFEIFGYSKEEMMEKDVSETYVNPQDREMFKKNISENGFVRNFEVKFRRKDTTEIDCNINAVARRDNNGNIIGFQGIIRDITEHKRTEEELRESEKRFRQIAENAMELIWEVDANGLYTYASPMVEKILGYEPEEIIGKKHFYDLFSPENREEVKNAAFEVFAKKLSFREFSNLNVHKTGKEVWLSTTGGPILDEKGELLGYRGADTDITERKKMEERRKELERMKSDFIILNAHELGTPLMVITGYLDILKDSTNRIGEDGRDAIRHIEMNLKRIETLQKAMYNITLIERNKFSLNKTHLFIHHIAKNVLNELRIMAERKGISFVPSFPTYDTILADADRIHKVISILVDNAIKYTPEGGTIEISGSENDHDIELSVRDNGIGIAQEEQENIFKEFYQVEDIMGHKDGFGLGLSLAKGIIESHGGDIRVESVPGKGSSFHIRIPKE